MKTLGQARCNFSSLERSGNSRRIGGCQPYDRAVGDPSRRSLLRSSLSRVTFFLSLRAGGAVRPTLSYLDSLETKAHITSTEQLCNKWLQIPIAAATMVQRPSRGIRLNILFQMAIRPIRSRRVVLDSEENAVCSQPTPS